MGTGVNIQDKLVALHHVDCPFRPSDIEQREGRILRQGNMNEEINIYRYVTKDSFDSYLWQIVEQKTKVHISSNDIKIIVRNCEDIDETVLSFVEVKALVKVDLRIKEKMDIDNDLARLRILKSPYDNQRYTLEDNFTYKYPRLIKDEQQRLECIIKDIEKRNMNATEKFPININGKLFDEREKAGTILKSFYSQLKSGKELHVGTYRGFNLHLRKSMLYESYEISIYGNLKYRVDLGESPHGNMVRIENMVRNLEDRMIKSEETIENHKSNLENSKLEYAKPFSYEEEYKTK